jgi:hypothetical protein
MFLKEISKEIIWSKNPENSRTKTSIYMLTKRCFLKRKYWRKTPEEKTPDTKQCTAC